MGLVIPAKERPEALLKEAPLDHTSCMCGPTRAAGSDAIGTPCAELQAIERTNHNLFSQNRLRVYRAIGRFLCPMRGMQQIDEARSKSMRFAGLIGRELKR